MKKSRIRLLISLAVFLVIAFMVDYDWQNKSTEPVNLEELKAEENAGLEKITGPDKDKYMTDPIPEGKPRPFEPENQVIDKTKTGKVTLSIDCKTILNNMGDFNMKKIDVLPEDGVILKETEVEFYEGESVLDLSQRVCRDNNIHMEFQWTPMYNSSYMEGIGNIYEFDCGRLSGWMFRVDGWFPNYGASRYKLVDGNKIEWIYTCDLGRDIGGVFDE